MKSNLSIRGAHLRGPHELILVLEGEFCIETTAKQVHRRLVDGFMDGSLEGEAAEGALELLGRFLSQEDFAAIRAADADLAGEGHARVRVYRDGEEIRWTKEGP